MSSTMPDNLGSAAAGGGAEAEEELSAAAVAIHLERPAYVEGL
jgi:hypothetical protein